MIIKELGYLPLAIEQAGAYIWAHGSAPSEYLMEYRASCHNVTEKQPEGLEGYATVYTTWQISLEAIKVESSEAAELLLLYGFLSNDVSDDLILHGKGVYDGGQRSQANVIKQLKMHIKLLLSYSLVKREVGKHRVSIHPVVHKWTRQQLTFSEKQQQTEHALNIVARAIDWNFKDKSAEDMLAFFRDILSDVEACVTNITDYLLD